MTSFIPSVVGQDSGAERRIDPRRALRANAELLIGGQRLEVRTLDISISGVGVATSMNPRTGLAVSLLLAPPDARRGTARIEMPVTVVHSILTRELGEFKVGLRFAEISPTALDAVKKYLAG